MKDLNCLEAENESLKVRILDYQQIDSINKNTIHELRQKVSDLYNLQSDFNNKITELQLLKNVNKELKEQIDFITKNEVKLHKELSQSDKVKHKLDEVENEYFSMQIQLEQAANQLIKVNRDVRYLEEQASRITLLECLLADVQLKRDELKLIIEKRQQTNC